VWRRQRRDFQRINRRKFESARCSTCNSRTTPETIPKEIESPTLGAFPPLKTGFAPDRASPVTPE
jgi:hypothetical protein